MDGIPNTGIYGVIYNATSNEVCASGPYTEWTKLFYCLLFMKCQKWDLPPTLHGNYFYYETGIGTKVLDPSAQVSAK